MEPWQGDYRRERKTMDQLPNLIGALHGSRCFQLLRALRLVGQLVEFGQDMELWLAPVNPTEGRQLEALVEVGQATSREKNHGGSHAHYRASRAIWAP